MTKGKEKTTAELFRICMKNGWTTLAECFREPELFNDLEK